MTSQEHNKLCTEFGCCASKRWQRDSNSVCYSRILGEGGYDTGLDNSQKYFTGGYFTPWFIARTKTNDITELFIRNRFLDLWIIAIFPTTFQKNALAVSWCLLHECERSSVGMKLLFVSYDVFENPRVNIMFKLLLSQLFKTKQQSLPSRQILALPVTQ